MEKPRGSRLRLVISALMLVIPGSVIVIPAKAGIHANRAEVWAFDTLSGSEGSTKTDSWRFFVHNC